MTDLDRLIAAVESGEAHEVQIFAKRISSSARDRVEFWPSHDVERSHKGSLDAAKALHEALLDSGFHAEIWACCTRPRVKVVRGEQVYDGHEQVTEARSWLLAILKALRSEQ